MSLAWPDHPLRLLPRWAGMALLVLTAAACLWNVQALQVRDTAHESDIAGRLERGERLDMDLYRAVDARVARGEGYYTAALEEHRAFGFPTTPFVAVRTPVLAWTTALVGAGGWRVLAALLWGANILAWFAKLEGAASRGERFAAAALAGLFGAIAFIDDIPFSHEALAGLMLSLALAFSRGRSWPLALPLAVFAVALRELALPFLLAWGAVALAARDRRETVALVAALILLGLGLALHAAGVAGARMAGDLVSPGWRGLLGPGLPLYGIHVTTLLQLLPLWLAGPLGVLPLLGWAALGGRLGGFALLWFAGFIAAAAVFARQENFYWMGLFVPAYGVGLAFVPRALAEILRPRPGASPTP